MKQRKASPFTASMAIAAMVAMNPGIIDQTVGRYMPERVSVPPTEDEERWLESLNSYRRQEWRRRFRLGLTPERRRYVDEQLGTFKTEGAEAGNE